MRDDDYRPYVVFAPSELAGVQQLRQERSKDFARGLKVMPSRDRVVAELRPELFAGLLRRQYREVLVAPEAWPAAVREMYERWRRRPY